MKEKKKNGGNSEKNGVNVGGRRVWMNKVVTKILDWPGGMGKQGRVVGENGSGWDLIKLRGMEGNGGRPDRS